MKVFVISLLGLVVFSSGFFVDSAFACMCAGDGTLEDQYLERDYIFSGKVSEIQPNPVRGKITLTVYEIWKGQPSESITILSGVGESDCSIPFEIGDNYLVFASKLVFDEPVTSGCSLTKPLIKASNEIEFLNTKTESQTVNFKYPVPGAGMIAHLYSLKTQIESGLSYDRLRCNEGQVLIQKYDGSPACVTESTKTKLVERGWTGNAERSIPDIEPTFLSKTITEWKSMPRKQLMDYHDNYHDNSFFSDLGRFLIKDAMKHEMEKHGIQNKYDDFTVYDEIMLTSLPPHAGFSAVVNATDQKTYLLGGSVFGNVIENGVHLRELVFYDILNSADSKDVELPYNKLLKTAPQVSISQDTDYIRSDPHIAIFDLEQSDSVVFHNDLKYLIRIQAYIPDDMDNTILKSGTISPNQTGTITFENIGMYEYDVLGYPDNDSGLWEQKGGGEIIAISQETKTLPLEEKLEIARSFLSYARDDIPFYSRGIVNGELRIGIQHSVEKSIPDYQEYYEKRIPQWIPFEIPVNVE